MLRILLALVVLGSVTVKAHAEDGNSPIIVPERLQQLAAENRVAERLQINWNADVSSDAVSRYLGLLAAINEVAETIARGNQREVPGDNDYLAAMAAFCLYPPNKPPIAE